MSEERFEKVRSIVASVYHVPVETVSLDKPLGELGADSLDAATLVFALEDEFHVQIPDECMDATRSLRALAEQLESLQAEAPRVAAADGS